MKNLNSEKLVTIQGGACDAGDAFAIGLGVASAALLIALPISAFWIVPAATVSGIGLGQAISNCIN